MKFSTLMSFSVLGAMFVGSVARADGFVCNFSDGEREHRLRAYIYNHTDREGGTRDASTVIITNPNHREGSRTIAVFKALHDGERRTNDVSHKETLRNRVGQNYRLDVDLRFNDISKTGANLLGTRLGMISYINVKVDFSYSEAAITRNGDRVDAVITAQKRAEFRGPKDVLGETTDDFELSCKRYIKGDVELEKAEQAAEANQQAD